MTMVLVVEGGVLGSTGCVCEASGNLEGHLMRIPSGWAMRFGIPMLHRSPDAVRTRAHSMRPKEIPISYTCIFEVSDNTARVGIWD